MQGASEYYPLDYPNCTPEGLCKASNSAYKARGACTDKTWNSPACSGYCKSQNSTGMSGITDCGRGGPWYCCNSDHDAGTCSCLPAQGTAFMLTGSTAPLYLASLPNNATAASISAAVVAGSGKSTTTASASGAGTTGTNRVVTRTVEETTTYCSANGATTKSVITKTIEETTTYCPSGRFNGTMTKIKPTASAKTNGTTASVVPRTTTSSVSAVLVVKPTPSSSAAAASHTNGTSISTGGAAVGANGNLGYIGGAIIGMAALLV